MSDDIWRITDTTDGYTDVQVSTHERWVSLTVDADYSSTGSALLTVSQALSMADDLRRRASAIQGSSAASAQAWHGTEGPK